MHAAESMSVPSQSNTRRSKRRGIGCGYRFQKFGEVARERRLVRHACARLRMREAEPIRVQEHALQSLPRELLVQIEVAVLVVARDRKAEVREMYPDLVRAAGLQFRFEQAVSGEA